MRTQIIAGALALAGTSAAFSDSSPWVLLSTSAFPVDSNIHQLQTSSQALETTNGILESCSTDRYLLISQPGAHAANLQGADGCALPHLCQAVDDSRINGKFIVSEVIGETSKNGLADKIKSACSGKGKDVVVDEVALPPVAGRQGALTESDDILAQSLQAATSTGSYTILFIGGQQEPIYEPEFNDAVHMDLKRHLGASRRADNNTEVDNRSLFEKYQFFTPGIFMGLIVAILLLSVLGVGISALGSLEVSYGAFEKDMGPAAQKKQQ